MLLRNPECIGWRLKNRHMSSDVFGASGKLYVPGEPPYQPCPRFFMKNVSMEERFLASLYLV